MGQLGLKREDWDVKNHYCSVFFFQRPQVQNRKTHIKHNKSHDLKPASDVLVKKVQGEGSALLRTVKIISGRLQEMEKVRLKI